MTKISKATMINETQGIVVIPTTQSYEIALLQPIYLQCAGGLITSCQRL